MQRAEFKQAPRLGGTEHGALPALGESQERKGQRWDSFPALGATVQGAAWEGGGHLNLQGRVLAQCLDALGAGIPIAPALLTSTLPGLELDMAIQAYKHRLHPTTNSWRDFSCGSFHTRKAISAPMDKGRHR